MKKALIIHNPASGTANAAVLETKLMTMLNGVFELQYERTTSFEHLISLCKPANIITYDFIIACGGDGTMNVVAKHLTNSSTPLAIIPSGSGNGLANSLKIRNIDHAIECIIRQNTEVIDTLKITNGANEPEFSVNVSGIGFDAHVAHLFSKEKKRGFWKYFQIVIREYKNKCYPVTIIHDNKTLEFDCLLVSIANSNQWGNNIKINPNSSLTDGTFELVCLEHLYFWNIPKLIHYLLKGKINKHKRVHIITTSKAAIKVQNAPLHIDGDYVGNVKTEVAVQILPKSLTVFVP